MSESIVVTGCAGFIGSHMVDLLLESGARVVGIDCFTYAGKVSNIRHHYSNPNFKMLNLDICDTAAVSSACRQEDAEWIINFAAESHVDNSIEDSSIFIHSNFIGVNSLLDVCHETGAKLLQISTDEVYGSTTGEPFLESAQLNPANPYSATKAAAEHLISAHQNTFGISYKMVRMSNNFGPRQDREKLIPTVIRSLQEGKKVPIYGTGENVRDWIFVKDSCRMIDRVLRDGKDNEVYNLSWQNEMTNVSLIKQITGILGVSYADNVVHVQDRLGHDFRYSIDNSKYKLLEEFVPTPFVTSLATTIKALQRSP